MIELSSDLGARLGLTPLPPIDAVQRVPGRDVEEEKRSGGTSVAPRIDAADLSAEGLAQLAQEQPDAEGGSEEGEGQTEGNSSAPRGADGEPLSREEQTQVEELQQRDSEVRAHENAHKAAAGELATGGPTYEYETGPDGREYAVGGEVQIALREGRTPEESVQLARKARAAALAPAEPSGQDRAVAAQASQMEARAQQKVQEERRAKLEEGDGSSTPELDSREAAYAATGSQEAPDLLGGLFG